MKSAVAGEKRDRRLSELTFSGLQVLGLGHGESVALCRVVDGVRAMGLSKRDGLEGGNEGQRWEGRRRRARANSHLLRQRDLVARLRDDVGRHG